MEKCKGTNLNTQSTLSPKNVFNDINEDTNALTNFFGLLLEIYQEERVIKEGNEFLNKHNSKKYD